jgi:hypothetical protein
VNTDGGLPANGEPVGASGLRQVHEVRLQLRGEAGEPQSPRDLKVGGCQVYGAPGSLRSWSSLADRYAFCRRSSRRVATARSISSSVL